MPTTRVPSRLIRSERRKITKQIFWFGGLSLALIALFLFVVLPLFIRFVNSVLDTNPIADDTIEILAQAPVISAPPTATNSAQLLISGVTSPELNVFIILNSSEDSQLQAKEDGSFETSITLRDGENSLVLYARDDGGNETRTSREYLILLDTESPALEIQSPGEGQQLSSKNLVEIAGITDAEARVYIDGRVVFPKADGSFSHSLQKSAGEHTLEITAVDEAGNETKIERVISVVD